MCHTRDQTLGGSEGNNAAERRAWWFFGEGFSFGAQCWLHSEVEWENRKSKASRVGIRRQEPPARHSAVTKDYKLVSLKQHTLIISQFWSSGGHDRSQRTKTMLQSYVRSQLLGENLCLELTGF